MFSCREVTVAQSPQCRVVVASPNSVPAARYIASATTQDPAVAGGPSVYHQPVCGSDSAPWQVEAAPGQQLRFTLHDFAVAQSPAAASAFCATYAVLREPASLTAKTRGDAAAAAGGGLSPVASSGPPRRLTVCGRKERKSVVYRSTGSAVEVRIIRQLQRPSKPSATDDSGADEDEKAYFLLEYEGTYLTIECRLTGADI